MLIKFKGEVWTVCLSITVLLMKINKTADLNVHSLNNNLLFIIKSLDQLSINQELYHCVYFTVMWMKFVRGCGCHHILQ